MTLNQKLPILIISIAIILFMTARCGKISHIYHVAIGTDGVTGVYYPADGAIARMVNKKSDHYKIRVTVESTSGSVYNINAVLSDDINFGITQSDRQFQACRGISCYSGKTVSISRIMGYPRDFCMSTPFFALAVIAIFLNCERFFVKSWASDWVVFLSILPARYCSTRCQ